MDKRISKIYVKYPDGTGEEASIYLSSTGMVEGLDEKLEALQTLNWDVYDEEEQKGE